MSEKEWRSDEPPVNILAHVKHKTENSVYLMECKKDRFGQKCWDNGVRSFVWEASEWSPFPQYTHICDEFSALKSELKELKESIAEEKPKTSSEKMTWDTEFYELVITPRWRLKKGFPKYTKKKCIHCNGTGWYETERCGGIDYDECRMCHGEGTQERLKRYPVPPSLDKKFLEDLKKFINSY